jgi:hypothetical protein
MILVRESLNFERGLDPLTSMNIGIQKQFINWMNELRLSRGVGSINLNHLTPASPWWLSIAYYEEPEYFNDCIKQFPDDTFKKINVSHKEKSFQYQYNLLINQKYEKYFINSFTSEGYIKESQNFERGTGNTIKELRIGKYTYRNDIENLIKEFIDKELKDTNYYINPNSLKFYWDTNLENEDSREGLDTMEDKLTIFFPRKTNVWLSIVFRSFNPDLYLEINNILRNFEKRLWTYKANKSDETGAYAELYFTII